MSRTGLFLAGLCVVVVAAAGCAEEDKGGGVGGGGLGGDGGTAGTGGQVASLRPCASEFGSPPPPDDEQSHTCTYDYESTTWKRTCTLEDGSEITFEYDDTKPCGMPCVTGRPFGGSDRGFHFDFARLPVARERLTQGQTARVDYMLDDHGNETSATTFDAMDQPTGTSTTTYTGDPQRPTSFERKLGGNVLVEGNMVWEQGEQRLKTYEHTNKVLQESVSLFTYTYDGLGRPTSVTWEDITEPAEPRDIGTFSFAYQGDTATVTLESPDGTPESVLTFDFMCEE